MKPELVIVGPVEKLQQKVMLFLEPVTYKAKK
jgi:hypothetical protein